MPVIKLKQFLDDNHVKYVTIHHSRAYTMQKAAEYAHISGKEVAKTVIVKIDGKMAMAVLPAPEHVDPGLLQGAAGGRSGGVGHVHEILNHFFPCGVGGVA